MSIARSGLVPTLVEIQWPCAPLRVALATGYLMVAPPALKRQCCGALTATQPPTTTLRHSNYRAATFKLQRCGVRVTALRHSNYNAAAFGLPRCGVRITALRRSKLPRCDIQTTTLRRSNSSVSRQTPCRRAMRSRRPTSRKPQRRCNVTLAVFSGKIEAWYERRRRGHKVASGKREARSHWIGN